MGSADGVRSVARMIYQVDETRDIILSSARQLFIDQGFFETQMKDVAQAAEVSRGSLYRYFKDKSDLALMVLDRIAGEMMAKPEISMLVEDRTRSGLDRTEVYLRLQWLNPAHTDAYRFFAEFDTYFSGRRIPPDFEKRLEAIFGRDVDNHLLDILDQGKTDGSIRLDLDSHLAMVTLINAVRSLHHRLLLRGKVLLEVHGRELEQMTDELIRYCMRGITSNQHLEE